MNKSLKQSQLDAVRQDIIDSNICPDLAAQATQLVMGSGNVDARIVMVGEAPGKSEDLTGLPFVGASGKFLDIMLASVGMSRDDLYITNIVKYRPPGNRDPKPTEKEAFGPYLLRQLEIIQPKVVVTLGRHSMEFFLPGAKISEVHGQQFEIDWHGAKLVIIPLYHPAAALYNGKMRSVLMDDFRVVESTILD